MSSRLQPIVAVSETTGQLRCRRYRAGIGYCLILLLACVSGSTLAQQTQDFDLSLEDDGISLTADDASLDSIADALSERLGIPFVLIGDTDSRVTIEVVAEPLETVVSQLSSNYLLKRRDNRPDADILEVTLLADDADSGSDVTASGTDEFLPTGEPAPAAEETAEEAAPEPADGADDGSQEAPDEASNPADPNATAEEADNPGDAGVFGPAPDAEFDYSGAQESGGEPQPIDRSATESGADDTGN